MGKRTLELNGVHVFRKVPNGQQHVLAEINPVLRITQGDNTLLIQHGNVFTPGGVLVPEKDVPEWFKAEVQKCNPKALEECGYHRATPVAPLRSKRVLAAKAEATPE